MFINRHVSGQLFRCRLFGLAILVYTAAASLAFAEHKPNHNPGRGGGDEGGGSRYDVIVSGALSSTTLVGFGGNSRLKPVSVGGTVILAGLSFFSDKFAGDRGKNCFDPDPDPNPVPVPGLQTSLAIFEAKDGSALVAYWFTGYADDGETLVGYMLEMYGYFMPNWRPVGGTTDVILETWEMFINGTGGVRNIACTGTGSIIPNGISTKVTVTEPQLSP